MYSHGGHAIPCGGEHTTPSVRNKCAQRSQPNGAGPRTQAACGKSPNAKGRQSMLYTLAIVLAVLWVLGLVTSNTMGGVIHVLLIIAIVVVLLRVIGGRKVL
jgi:hypothetical protein